MPKRFSVEWLIWVLLTLMTALLVVPSQSIASYSLTLHATFVDGDKYGYGRLQGVVSFQVFYLDSAVDRQSYLDRKSQAPPIRHFEGATSKNFQEKLEHKKYHQVCDRKSPQGLPPCEEASWKYRQAIACLQAREAWEARWGRPETLAPHGRALENVRAWLKNARADKERYCDTEREQSN
ncbi:hypothetical protein BTJ40_13440 [Microbulbifer sp. A4B17]|uniref:hypothetical protein n=1 Tax=Microbulbifer sp. A4B17 TaxID=359370 RepID=UPI000D52D5D1|nr:hypothetical protein [Microbulbifer sp. A4B17]AWF81748.1 hypothetical protein BTJ40_13440 [Microbulbifer sp. A4B17]